VVSSTPIRVSSSMPPILRTAQAGDNSREGIVAAVRAGYN
jgi:hypothetical protein